VIQLLQLCATFMINTGSAEALARFRSRLQDLFEETSHIFSTAVDWHGWRHQAMKQSYQSHLVLAYPVFSNEKAQLGSLQTGYVPILCRSSAVHHEQDREKGVPAL
jgi:hypothetical protein